jgi:hypothetical protein
MPMLNRLFPALRWILGLPAAVLVLSSCSSVQPYSVTYKNVSTEKVTEARGLWGEYFLLTGMLSPDRGFPKRGGFTNGYVDLPIPPVAGARWKNAAGEQIKVEIPLDKHLFPLLNKDEDYQFVFELRQTDIRQVELVVHDTRALRSKKRKVMLYCAVTEVNGCQFNTPFNTDTFYDSPEQEAKAKAMKAAAAKAKYGDKNKQSEK